MFNYNTSKNEIIQRLLDLSANINNYVSLSGNIEDWAYQMKVGEIERQFSYIVGYQNYSMTSFLSSKIHTISYTSNKNNALKLLEINSAILETARMMRW